MTPNAFIGQAQAPSDAALSAVLGAAKPIWDRLIAELAAELGVKTQEWKSYSLKAGWSLRLLRGKRTIVWLAPCEGSFRVAFALGDKALAVARMGEFSAEVMQVIAEAPKYPEGSAVRLEITRPEELGSVKRLAEIKISN